MSAPKQYLLLPGPEDWEWFHGVPGGPASRVPPPEPRPASRSVTLGLPCRWLFSLPLALDVPEGTEMEDLVQLSLERNSLPTAEGKWNMLRLAESGSRKLLHVFSLPDPRRQKNLPLPEESAVTAIPAWQVLPPQPNHLVLYRELGRWALVYFRDGKCAFSRDLSLKELKPDHVGMIRQVIAQIETAGFITTSPSISLLHPVSDSFTGAMRAAGFSIAPIGEKNGIPRLPEPESFLKLLPAPIEERLEQETRQEQRKKFGAIAVITLILTLLGVGAFWFWNQRSLDQLRRELAEVQPVAEELQQTDALWNRLSLAIEPNLYPVETLHRITSLLPEKEIRITQFEQSGREVVVRGEAKNPSRIFAWVKSMKNEPACAHLEWLDPSIKMLPGNVTQFILQGSLRYAPDQ